MAGAETLGHNMNSMGFDDVFRLLALESEGQIDRVGKYAISDVEGSLEAWRYGPPRVSIGAASHAPERYTTTDTKKRAHPRRY